MLFAGAQFTRVFDEPELAVKFKCDIHSWMNGYVHVLEHPFFAVTDVEGKFEIAGLPPGQYVLEAWHEELGPVQFDVTVQASTSTRADATLTR